MKKILFFIHDLGSGGAEKVLVNLVNNMDREKFDVTVMVQFGGGVNEQFLAPHIKLLRCHKKAFQGNSHVMKLFSPKTLYKHYVKEHYDIVVSYLEGPSARIISGCPDKDTKKVSWIHSNQNKKSSVASFRSKREAEKCYNSFDVNVCVSKWMADNFKSLFSLEKEPTVLYNTNESEKIKTLSEEKADEIVCGAKFKIISVGSLKSVKGFDRLARIHKRLKGDGYPVHTYVLGKGPDKEKLVGLVKELDVGESFTLLGYHTNPYKFVSKCDLFVCSSYSEGFSTAATEALIVGTPVCTVRVSGMDEMLGDNEYGLITENSEEALYEEIKLLLDDPKMLEYYRNQAKYRGNSFSTENTVKAVEDMFLNLV